MSVNLSMDCLRSFVSIVELGSFARAACKVGRTAPAISLQMERLENQVGMPLFEKNGRSKVVTSAGIEFFEHARAILAQNDAALRLAHADKLAGVVRLGIVQDFAEDFFPKALSAFSEQFHNIRIEVIVERSQLLLELLETGALDQVIAFSHDTSSDATLLRRSDMVWLAKGGNAMARLDPVPLVMVDGSCLFRKAALKSLAAIGRSWEIRLSSPSMACVTAAAEAGLGLAVRTPDILQTKKSDLARVTELPDLPSLNLQLYSRPHDDNPATRKLGEYWLDQFCPPLTA